MRQSESCTLPGNCLREYAEGRGLSTGSRQTLKYVPLFVKTLKIINKLNGFGHSKRYFEGFGCAALLG